MGKVLPTHPVVILIIAHVDFDLGIRTKLRFALLVELLKVPITPKWVPNKNLVVTLGLIYH